MKIDKTMFHAFNDSTASTMIDNLTLENQGNRLSIYGSLQITCDRQGLQYAQELALILQQSIQYLESRDLPLNILQDDDTTEIKNPFL